MKPVAFTQYLRPNGQKRQMIIDMPDEIAEKAEKLIALGCVFEIEELATGKIYMNCTNLKIDEQVYDVLCDNNEQVPKAVEHLIDISYVAIFQSSGGPFDQLFGKQEALNDSEGSEIPETESGDRSDCLN